MAPRGASEEELGRKWDRCFVDTTFKTAGGAIFGALFSFLFFKRAAWPVTLGIGVGLGAGYSNCRHQLLWHAHHGPPFRGPPWGTPFWGGPVQDSDGVAPCKGPSKEERTAVQPTDSTAEVKDEKPAEN